MEFFQNNIFQIFAVALLVAVAVAVAAPQGNPDAAAAIVKYDSDNIGVDGYSYR